MSLNVTTTKYKHCCESHWKETKQHDKVGHRNTHQTKQQSTEVVPSFAFYFFLLYREIFTASLDQFTKKKNIILKFLEKLKKKSCCFPELISNQHVLYALFICIFKRFLKELLWLNQLFWPLWSASVASFTNRCWCILTCFGNTYQ